MVDVNKTIIMMIMDASGSMQGKRHNAAVGGYNEFISGQREVSGKCLVSFVTFNTRMSEIYTMKDINEIGELRAFSCGGNTAIYDVLGGSIVSLGYRLSEMDESDRPGKVIVVLMTDGEENSSREYSYDQVKEMMDHQHGVYGWEFVIMGSKDISVSSIRGIAGECGPCGPKGMQFDIDNERMTKCAYSVTSDAVSRFRRGVDSEVGYGGAGDVYIVEEDA